MRHRDYWLHFETDSVAVRGEKEELLLALFNNNTQLVRTQRVRCLDTKDWNTTLAHPVVKVGACGNNAALPAIMRHTSHLVNVYTFDAGRHKTVVSVSLAAGTCGSKLFGGRCNGGLGRCSLAMTRHVNDTSQGGMRSVCNDVAGVGSSYWSGLFRAVASSVGRAEIRPNAIVLSYGLHFPHCEDVGRYTSHLKFWLGSVRAVYDGALIWRSVSPPQYDPSVHAHPPAGCVSVANVTQLDLAARGVLPPFHAVYVDTAPTVAGWGAGTMDAIHF